MPKIDKLPWRDHAGGAHPITGQADGPYSVRPLGDVIGLSQYGVHLERLRPGSRSSHRHWHEGEDEFVYVISGELILIEDEETILTAGDAAGWPGGMPVAHCLENRSDCDAVFLVVGTRLDRDVVHYPDHDLILHRHNNRRRYTRTDGSPIEGET